MRVWLRTTPAKVSLAALCITAPVGASTGVASARPSVRVAMHKMTMVGNMDAYPDLERAGRRNVRRARRLQRASQRTAHRFDTLAKARALGYETRRMRRPGFVHARKFDTRFWGKMFNPAAPQALVFWCPASGPCTLTTYMYRAPAGPPPSTWRLLLQWHRHGDKSTTWMTHVWLVPHIRAAFATCAPWTALKATYGLKQPKHYDNQMFDQPCPEDDSMPMQEQ
jgi:hypothetical protein